MKHLRLTFTKTTKPALALSMLAFFAAATTGMSQPALAEESLLFGQKQAYTAVVRADKKVVTYGKIYLNNAQDTELKNTSFTLPGGVGVSNLSLYQVTLPERCQIELAENKDTPQPRDASYYNGSNYNCDRLEESTFNFDEYGYGYYVPPSDTDSQLVYKTINSSKNGGTYNLSLPNPLKPQERGAYIVSYIANEGYVTGSFGLYNLKFKTLKVPQSIEEVRVAVDVASDLYTREKRSEITSNKASLDLASGATEMRGSSIQNKSLDELQGSIGSGGTFTKTGKSLAPNEEFVVNGEFADAAWKLNIGWIVGSIVGLVVIIGLLILLLKKAQQQDNVTGLDKERKNAK